MSDDYIYRTENYNVEIVAPDKIGYYIRNINTGAIEAHIETEPLAILTAMKLQDVYDEVMDDPERAYARREAALFSRIQK